MRALIRRFKRLAVLPIALILLASVTFTTPQKAEAATLVEYALLVALLAVIAQASVSEEGRIRIILGDSCVPQIPLDLNEYPAWQELYADLFGQASDIIRECVAGYAKCPSGCDFSGDAVCNLYDVYLAEAVADGHLLPSDSMLCNPTRTHQLDKNHDGSLTRADLDIFLNAYQDQSLCDEELDSDGDGACGIAEAIDLAQGLFDNYVDLSLDPAPSVYQN